MYSEHPGKEFGKFVRSNGKFFNDAENDKGTYLGNDTYLAIKHVYGHSFI